MHRRKPTCCVVATFCVFENVLLDRGVCVLERRCRVGGEDDDVKEHVQDEGALAPLARREELRGQEVHKPPFTASTLSFSSRFVALKFSF